MKKIFSFIWKVLFPSGVKAGMFVRILGYALLIFGVVNLLYRTFFLKDTEITTIGEFIALNFFIIMLGISLIFPSLLQDRNQGLSTMRFTVFMMTNVICLLLLKLGWNAPSLNSVGLDEYWMGMIAFIFGAKAAQTYFERKNGEMKEEKVKEEKSNDKSSETPHVQPTTNDSGLIKVALQKIKESNNPNVLGIGTLQKMENGVPKYYIQMTVKDEKTKSYFEQEFTINGVAIPFDIHVVTPPKTHSGFLPGTGIRNRVGNNGNGTFGCVVIDLNTNKRCLLSCQHVLKADSNYNVINSDTDIILSNDSNEELFATHIKGSRDNEIDAGIAKLVNQKLSNEILGRIRGERDVTAYDIITNKRVTIEGYDTIEQMVIPRSGVIINDEYDVTLDYKDNNPPFTINDTILLSHNNSDSFDTISKPGYSGAMVIDEDKYIIGMVVGGDDKFTYAIPINRIKERLNIKILR